MDFANKLKKSSLKALVVGDSALDCNAYTKITAISREVDGIPVNSIMKETDNPGGAANLAANLSHLGIETTLASVWGDERDRWRASFEYCLLDHKITPCMAIAQTGVYGKLYYHASKHHWGRLDVPMATPSTEEASKLATKINVSTPDFVLVLDQYEVDLEGGLLSHPAVYMAACSLNVPVYVSSRQRLHWFKNASAYVGNTKEAGIAMDNMGVSSIKDLLYSLKGLLFVETKGAIGSHIHKTHGLSTFVPTEDVIEQKNICGCGDTYLAIFAIARTLRYSTVESAKLASAGARYTAKQLQGTGYPRLEDIENEYNEIYGQPIHSGQYAEDRISVRQ